MNKTTLYAVLFQECSGEGWFLEGVFDDLMACKQLCLQALDREGNFAYAEVREITINIPAQQYNAGELRFSCRKGSDDKPIVMEDQTLLIEKEQEITRLKQRVMELEKSRDLKKSGEP